MKTYNLFVSHSWNYTDHYNGLVALLENDRYFHFKNYSVPRHSPVHGARNDSELRSAIYNQMAQCSAVIILAGVYSTYSKWINIEIDLAKKWFSRSKPIIAVVPWHAKRTSLRVKKAADRVVSWRTASIVNAIREVTV